MKIPISLRLAGLLLPLSLLSCDTLSTTTTGDPTETSLVEEEDVGPQPGGELVINYNPALSSYGPTFSIGYNHGGSQTTIGGVIHYELEIGSDESNITVGLETGTRATLTEDETYVVDITNLAGPTVTIKNKNNPAESYTVSVGDGVDGDYKSPIFAVINRKNYSGGVEYIRVAVVKGTKFIYFDVNE